MSSRLVFFQVSPRRHSNKVTFQGTKYRQTGYLKVVLGCIFHFFFFTLLLKRALLVAEIVIIIGGAAFGPPQGRWESEQADEERRTLCLRQRCLTERLIRIWPCYRHHLVAAVHIRPDADSQDAPCFHAYLYINEVYTIFFLCSMKEITNFHSSVYSKFLDPLQGYGYNVLSPNVANYSHQCRLTAGNPVETNLPLFFRYYS